LPLKQEGSGLLEHDTMPLIYDTPHYMNVINSSRSSNQDFQRAEKKNIQECADTVYSGQ
jgi:hypothetical protein